jgi:hypothetical protein
MIDKPEYPLGNFHCEIYHLQGGSPLREDRSSVRNRMLCVGLVCYEFILVEGFQCVVTIHGIYPHLR